MQLLDSIPFSAIAQVSALLKAYLAASPDLRHLYSFAPAIESIPAAIAAKSQQTIDRDGLHAEITRQYAHTPCSELTARNIALLTEKNTFCITAAHQPALFTGPLYTFYKIASVIHIALACKEKFPQYDFVPVFWMGSEDHDFDELNHTFIAEKKIQFSENYAGPIGRFRTAGWQGIAEEAMSVSPNPAILRELQPLMDSETPFVQITKKTLQLLFDQYGLVIVNQDNVFFKRQFADIIADEVLQQRASKVLHDTTAFLQVNYHSPIALRDINFFKINDHSRLRIAKEGAHFRMVHTDEKYTTAEVVADIGSHPEHYSPNVVFRPLLQEKVLPNLCFVGGGGEVSYWLQLKALFDFYHIPYPVLTLRNSYFVTNSFIEKKREKYGLSHLDFFADKESVVKRWVLQQEGDNLDFSKEEKALHTLYENIVTKLKNIDPTLEGAAKAELQKSLGGMHQVRQKMIKAAKRNNEELENALQKIYEQLFPAGVWQERHQNFLRFTEAELKQLSDYLIYQQDGFSQAVKVVGF